MVWRAEDPQGHEALKCRYDIVPYLGDTLLDIGCGATKVFDYAVGIDSLRDTHLLRVSVEVGCVLPCSSPPHLILPLAHIREHIDIPTPSLAPSPPPPNTGSSCARASRAQVQSLHEGGAAVVAQALGVGHRDQEQVQRSRSRLAAVDEVLLHERLVNPAELLRDLPQPLGPK
jgi:hypothetical protein